MGHNYINPSVKIGLAKQVHLHQPGYFELFSSNKNAIQNWHVGWITLSIQSGTPILETYSEVVVDTYAFKVFDETSLEVATATGLYSRVHKTLHVIEKMSIKVWSTNQYHVCRSIFL